MHRSFAPGTRIAKAQVVATLKLPAETRRSPNQVRIWIGIELR
jgi:hypothetical protein